MQSFVKFTATTCLSPACLCAVRSIASSQFILSCPLLQPCLKHACASRLEGVAIRLLLIVCLHLQGQPEGKAGWVRKRKTCAAIYPLAFRKEPFVVRTKGLKRNAQIQLGRFPSLTVQNRPLCMNSTKKNLCDMPVIAAGSLSACHSTEEALLASAEHCQARLKDVNTWATCFGWESR